MKYLLRKHVPGKVLEIEITPQEYADFETARNILVNALAIEETYEVLIVNYLDFERQIFDATANSMVRQHLDYSDFFDVRLSLNIRLVNLLTAARLYAHQLPHNVPQCVPNITGAKEMAEKLLQKEHDNNKDYRFMEALRNYVQHRGLPVHLTKHGGRWTSLQDNGFLEFSIELASQRSLLQRDTHFNKTVLAEMDENIDLKSTTRSYVESISSVHESARNMITESVKSARELIEHAHRQYDAVHTGSLTGLSASKWSNGREISAIPLLLDWDNVRLELQKRNRHLANLKKRYVTGSIKTHGE